MPSSGPHAWFCIECGRPLAEAAAVRRRRGLPLRSPYSATCSDRCERAREPRFQREARDRGHELGPSDWRCGECGRTVDEALDRGKQPLAVYSRTCSPECKEFVALHDKTDVTIRLIRRAPSVVELVFALNHLQAVARTDERGECWTDGRVSLHFNTDTNRM